jgi:hypothetical protein
LSCSLPLVLKAAVPHLSQSIEEHCPSQSILGFTFVQPGIDPTPQINILQPIQGEQGPFNLAQFT